MIIGKAISPFALRKKINGDGGNDPDAQLFITATGISGTNATATNQLVLDLKSANIWTKMKAVYPFVGGTASSQKYNLKDARDLDAAYRLTFFGGGTFSSSGYQSNGTNAYVDTFLAPNIMALNSIHGSVYLQQDNAANGAAFGSEVASTFANGFYLFPKQTTPFNCSVRINDNTSQNTIMGNIKGLNLITRTASNVKKYKLNTTNIFSVTTVSSAAHTESIHIAKTRNNSGYYSNLYSFASFGDGLTDAEALALYNAVQLFNTTLGRQV